MTICILGIGGWGMSDDGVGSGEHFSDHLQATVAPAGDPAAAAGAASQGDAGEARQIGHDGFLASQSLMHAL